MTMVLQYLCIKLGVVTGNDLASSCRKRFTPFWNMVFYILCEVAIIACDLAEVIGTAIGLNLLFGLPLPWGIAITALDVLVILALWGRRCLRVFEGLIMVLVVGVAACFVYLLHRSNPVWGDVLGGFLPRDKLFTEDGMLYVAMGIVGATAMPHNLYIHSSIVRYRAETGGDSSSQIGVIRKPSITKPSFAESQTDPKKLDEFDDETVWNTKERVRAIPKLLWFTQIDSAFALTLAFVVNSSILIVSSSNFFTHSKTDVAELRDAFDLITTFLGKSAAIVFAIALLLAGQSSTMTGTIAGQIVMEGFLGGPNGLANRWRIPAWTRRLVTRVCAVIPAMVVAIVAGETGVGRLLVGSQVVLSLQLPFAIWPLVLFTSSRGAMTVEVDDDASATDVEGRPVTAPLKETTVAKLYRHLRRRGANAYCFVNEWPLTFVSFLIAAVITVFNVILILQVAGVF
ncbi:hypothetical protein HDU67_007439 [Dinochytrium kinnereticum]|nr:hypothetical protein HDU67_007439 [Dinochytrium kinnereticum]